MGPAPISNPKYCSALLAWLLCGSFASAAVLAQSDPGVVDPVPAESEDAAPDGQAASAASASENGAPSAVELSPIARNEQFVTDTRERFGQRSLQLAEAYGDLADAHRAAEQYEEAAEQYLAAVEVYRAVDGPFTPLAIGPLTRLGDNYHEAEDDVNAVAAYSEARTVSRRAYGLHNVEQIALLDRMSESLLELNDVTEAEAQQVEALRLVQRANPPGSDAVLEGIYKYAEWLGERARYQNQRDQYERARRIIRNVYGERDLRQVRPLLGVGNTYRQERNPAGLGISSLEEALSILLEQPERDSVAIARTLRDIGDWTVAFGKTGYNGTEYQRAWQLLGSVPNGSELRRQWFTGANYVLYEPISPRSLSMDPGAANGHVTVRFDLDTAGNSANVTLVDSDPVGLKDEAVLRHIRRSRFRPLIADGEVIPGKGLGIQVTFRYLPDADDEDKG
jgi:TonB family protein